MPSSGAEKTGQGVGREAQEKEPPSPAHRSMNGGMGDIGSETGACICLHVVCCGEGVVVSRRTTKGPHDAGRMMVETGDVHHVYEESLSIEGQLRHLKYHSIQGPWGGTGSSKIAERERYPLLLLEIPARVVQHEISTLIAKV